MLTALLPSLFAFSSSVLLTNWSIVSWPTLYIVCRTSYSTTFYNIGKILYSRIGKLDRYSRCFLVKVAKSQRSFFHFWSHFYITWKIVCCINKDKLFGHYIKDWTQRKRASEILLPLKIKPTTENLGESWPSEFSYWSMVVQKLVSQSTKWICIAM